MAARAFLTLVALLCLGASSSEARTFKPGSAKARWSIKTSVLAGADLAHPKNVPLENLLGLGDVPGVSAQDSRFTKARIPNTLEGLHEGDMIRTEGWVHLVACEGDGDYHLQISNSRTSGNHCLVVEMPMDKATFEKDAKLRGLYATLRPFLRQELLHDVSREFSEAGNWMKSEVYMSVTGQLLGSLPKDTPARPRRSGRSIRSRTSGSRRSRTEVANRGPTLVVSALPVPPMVLVCTPTTVGKPRTPCRSIAGRVV